jgi:methionyl-tRNA formyltransferase
MKHVGILPRETNRTSGRRVQSVVVMGKGDLAIRAAEWFLQSSSHELVAVVPVIPEPKWALSLSSFAASMNVKVIESGHYQDLPSVREDGWQVDLVISIFYDRIIKDWFISKCPRILNLHNGPLPKYRGVSPINWALKNGEQEHGVTIHEITPGIDDGPIVAQVKYSIYPEVDEVIDVYRRAIEYGWVLFQQTIPILDKLTPRTQDGSQASYYSKREDPLLGERRNFTREQSLFASGNGHNHSPSAVKIGDLE